MVKFSFSEEELVKAYYENELSCVDIAKEKGCDEGLVRYYMDKFRLFRRSRSEVAKLIAKKHPDVNVKLHPNLGFSENLAYILGVLKGDGWINKNKWNYRVGLSATELNFVESFAESLKQIGLNPEITLRKLPNPNHHDQYYLEANSKEFYNWYKGLTLNDIQTLINENTEYAIAFLRGFYESEGNISKASKNSYRLAIYNSDKELIEFVKQLIGGLEIPTSLYSTKRDGKKREYTIRILGRAQNIKRFLSLINPIIKGAKEWVG